MKSVLMFIGGIVVGAGVSWIYHKNKYEQMVQEEIDSLREHAKEGKTKISSEYGETINDTQEDKIIDEDIAKVEKIIDSQNYISDAQREENMRNGYRKPFVVTPEDFTSIPGFDSDTFYYHTNDIISNDNNEIVDDVESILGLTTEEIKNQFGHYEDDAVYIRNMRLKCDYEILREEEDYVRRNGD